MLDKWFPLITTMPSGHSSHSSLKRFKNWCERHSVAAVAARLGMDVELAVVVEEVELAVVEEVELDVTVVVAVGPR